MMEKSLVCYILATVFFGIYGLLPLITADSRADHLFLGGGGAAASLGLAFAAEAAA